MRRKRKVKTDSATALKLPGVFRYNLGTLLAGGGTVLLVIALIAAYLSPEARYERAARAAVRKAEADAYVAHDRYLSGCTLPWVYVNKGKPNESIQAIALSENIVYTDGSFGVPIAPLDKVCDDNGLSGVIGQTGMLEDPRRASNMDLVNQRYADSMGWHPRHVRSNTSFGNQ